MKNIYIKKLTLLLILFLLSSTALNAQPGSPEQLKDELKAAMKAKNKDMISALFNWEGVDSQMREYSQKNIDRMAEFPAQEIELLPLPEGFKTEFIRDGIRYTPNVKLVGILRIIYGDDGPETDRADSPPVVVVSEAALPAPSITAMWEPRAASRHPWTVRSPAACRCQPRNSVPSNSALFAITPGPAP